VKAFVLVALLLFAPGCMGNSDEGGAPTPPAGTMATGETETKRAASPLTIAEALESPPAGRVVIRGWLYFELIPTQKPPRLCASIAQATFPRCTGPSLRVDGIRAGNLDLDGTANGTHLWSREEIELQGTIDGRVLTLTSQPKQ